MDTKAFREGFRDGIPIGLGYLAVSFSLGISAKQAGLTPLQGFVTSFLENASAGEYIAFTLIGAGATYIELCLMTIIANARYLLMSCAMSQRFSPLYDFTAETSDAAFSVFPFLPCAIVVFGLFFALAVTQFGKKEMR